MCEALAALPCTAGFRPRRRQRPAAPALSGRGVIKGDSSIASIAAASIVAKVVRDRMMARLHGHYPSYGFATNAGYSTAAHLTALGANGPCPFHRQSFAPLRQGLLDL